jgi:hypothetical protein
MSPWWLFLIIPGTFYLGYFTASLKFLIKEKKTIIKHYFNKVL